MALTVNYFTFVLATFLMQSIVVAQTAKSQKKCSLPEDISIFPDFAQDEIRAVWKDYIPGTKCDKELLITEDILAVLEMFDKEFENQKRNNPERQDYGPNDNERESYKSTTINYADLNEKDRIEKNTIMRKDIPPLEPINVPSFVHEKIRQPTHPPATPSLPTPRPTRPPPSEFLRPTAPIIPDPPIDETKSEDNSARSASNSYGRNNNFERADNQRKLMNGVSWRVKSTQRSRSEKHFDIDDSSASGTIFKPRNFTDKPDSGYNKERAYRFGIMRNQHQYDIDYINSPQEEANIRGRSRSSKTIRSGPINTSDTVAQQDFNYDTSTTNDVIDSSVSIKQLDENLPFLRDADDDVVAVFQETLDDPDLPSENRRMEELHLLAVSYLNKRQLAAFDLWATKRRKAVKNLDNRESSAFRADNKPSSGRRQEVVNARRNLSSDARKALSTLTHNVVTSDASTRAQILRLPPAVRSELRDFSRSFINRKFKE